MYRVCTVPRYASESPHAVLVVPIIVCLRKGDVVINIAFIQVLEVGPGAAVARVILGWTTRWEG